MGGKSYAIKTSGNLASVNDGYGLFGEDGTSVVSKTSLTNLGKTYYPERIKNRYNALRGWILYEASLHYELYKIAIGIPKLMMDEDSRLWPTRPGTSTNNIGQIKDYMRIRFLLLDYNVTTI